MPPLVKAPSSDLNTDVASLVDLLATNPRTAAPTIAELVVLLGMDEDRIQDAMADADVLGLIQTWDHPDDGLCLMLSAIEAEARGLRLSVDDGPMKRTRYRWVPAKKLDTTRDQLKPRARTLQSSQFGYEYGDAGLVEDIIDERSPSPLDGASNAEKVKSLPWVRARAKMSEFQVTRPTHFLLGLPWTTSVEELSCEVCDGSPLGVLDYCTKCDRWGGDFLLRKVPKRELLACAEAEERRRAEDEAEVVKMREAFYAPATAKKASNRPSKRSATGDGRIDGRGRGTSRKTA